jgi:hypothetical protein
MPANWLPALADQSNWRDQSASSRYRNPAACSARRSAISGRVSRPRLARMMLRTASDHAHDSDGTSRRYRRHETTPDDTEQHQRASNGARLPADSVPPVRSVELFAGAGGLALGCELAGFKTIRMVEWDRWACDTSCRAARRRVPRDRRQARHLTTKET